ncbi:MAG: DUF3305 domain-containing protein [Pseudomonadota bacterium]
MTASYPGSQSIRLGIFIEKSPGVTRWGKWSWAAQSVVPGAPDADWRIISESKDVTLYHAATRTVTLYVSDTEAYVHELSTDTPSVYVVMRSHDDRPSDTLEIVHVTASPYEAQDFCDSGEEVVEKIQMPPALLAWVEAFVARNHVEEPFVKRRRTGVDQSDQCHGIGDPRITQSTDVYRAPTLQRQEAAE